MGSNIVNLSLKGATQRLVLDAIATLLSGHDYFVSPASEGWVSVFDSDFESFDVEEIIETAKAICRRCSLPALLAAVYDSDVLMLWVIDNRGNVEAEFNSCPDYFESGVSDQEVCADAIAEATSALCPRRVTSNQIAENLKSDNTFMEDTLTALGDLLGVRYLAWSYDTLADCGVESCADFDEFAHIT